MSDFDNLLKKVDCHENECEYRSKPVTLGRWPESLSGFILEL